MVPNQGLELRKQEERPGVLVHIKTRRITEFKSRLDYIVNSRPA